jgi:hypothetical protein
MDGNGNMHMDAELKTIEKSRIFQGSGERKYPQAEGKPTKKCMWA